jgi:hypothetical protein
MVIHIQGRVIEYVYVSDLLWVPDRDIRGEISTIEGLVVGASVSVLMAELDGIHLTFLG